jgi:hypothetical protein
VRLHLIRCKKREFVWSVALAFLCLVAAPCRLLGEDKANSDGSPKKSTEVDAPVPVTERERILMDRLEELERRVADLEASRPPAASPANSEVAATGKSQPDSVQPTSPKGGATPAPAAVASAAVGPAMPPGRDLCAERSFFVVIDGRGKHDFQ